MFVPRPHLIDALEGKQCRLQLLCAPAGYGKTSLLQQYLQGVAPPGQVVWMSLGAQWQTLEHFISGLAGELGLAVDTAADAVLAFLDSRAVVPELLLSRAGSLLQGNAVNCRSEPARDEALEVAPIHLVFDDLPVDMPADLNHWFDQLLSLKTPRLQVLVTCRQRPDWNLPRLMLTGQLQELGTGQLALRPDEFESLIDALAPHTDAPAREKLWHETGGWCAGIRLSLSLEQAQSSPLLAQYLERELLSRLSQEQREVLCGLAHLSRFSAHFCEQLWEGQQGGRVFNSLLHGQAFVFPVEQQSGWFRLLPAVALALQHQLTGLALNRLRLRACQLLSVLGHVDEAVEQALCADQPEVAANYMERLWLSWILGERHLSKLMDWRERIEPQLLHSSPRLIYLCAKALLFSGRLDEAAECLARLGHFLPLPDTRRNQRLLANWQALYGTLQALRGHADSARLHCRAALDDLTAEDWLSVLLCHCILARIAMEAGDLVEAQSLLDHSLELARRQGSHESEVLVNVDRTRLLMLQGQWGQAQSLVRSELNRLTVKGAQPYPLLGRLLFAQGELLLQQGHTHEAEVVVQAGLLQVRDCCAPFVLNGYLLLSEIASRSRDPEKARWHLYEAERRMHWGKIHAACYQGPIARQKARIAAREQPANDDKVLPVRLTGVANYQDDLTPREVSVLKLLAEGMSVREVGSRLFISENTVKTHAKNINVKLGACRRTQAINSAKAMGILA
ncbi:helix-turn-helix transcriptional regulator [Pseudomonas fluorescens]|uniref:helix-turn-helix transcriptional regulator n=1 Tax=Pseudomonas fluorescens TaxID=294 RepID=UPI0012496A2A|nr:LuxR C-terminal-related transcriptional regulator [Pseudomonas fluorescens]CAG8871454.1 HTH-type transcriptional regulator MalT [Pseudomonas fluorescens]